MLGSTNCLRVPTCSNSMRGCRLGILEAWGYANSFLLSIAAQLSRNRAQFPQLNLERGAANSRHCARGEGITLSSPGQHGHIRQPGRHGVAHTLLCQAVVSAGIASSPVGCPGDDHSSSLLCICSRPIHHHSVPALCAAWASATAPDGRLNDALTLLNIGKACSQCMRTARHCCADSCWSGSAKPAALLDWHSLITLRSPRSSRYASTGLSRVFTGRLIWGACCSPDRCLICRHALADWF